MKVICIKDYMKLGRNVRVGDILDVEPDFHRNCEVIKKNGERICDRDSYVGMKHFKNQAHEKINQNKKENEIMKENKITFCVPATVAQWEDGDKTVVKTTGRDKFDPQFGFLMAYFQKHSGMTKTQAGKFMDELNKMFEEQSEIRRKKDARKAKNQKAEE